MKFNPSAEGTISARKYWHDAFISDVRAIDYEDLANGAGVQFTAKGSDNCTMSHCDKGKIQQAIHNLKQENKLAWAWGMFSCAPDGVENKNALVNMLFKYAMESVPAAYLKAINKTSAFMSMECGKLARIAMEHAKIEVNSKVRHPHGHAEMAALLRVSKEDYKKIYLRIFVVMKDALRDLDGAALPPVARVVWLLIDKAQGDFAQRANAVEDLQGALKTKQGVAA